MRPAAHRQRSSAYPCEIVAGLDQRYGWTDGLPLVVQITALTLCVLGYALVVWATASNSFFSQIVRKQSERGHAVVTGGPYHYVRHPAYAGAILYELAVPVLLGSWWALVVSGLGVVLLVLRTALEDHTLQAELMGYVDYARQVRYHLLPGIW
jgi:protein-S-isoprenylcysteine O-methyltransferase Ste14